MLPREHVDGTFGFGVKGNRSGNAGFVTTLAIIGSAGRQIQFAVNQGVPTWSDPGEKDPNLTVFDPPCGATVLASDAG